MKAPSGATSTSAWLLRLTSYENFFALAREAYQ